MPAARPLCKMEIVLLPRSSNDFMLRTPFETPTTHALPLAGGKAFMPLDLPGFYFDVARNRYFPINTRFPNSNNYGADSGLVHKESSPIVAHGQPKKACRERNTKLRRDAMTSLWSSERHDALQYVFSVPTKSAPLTYLIMRTAANFSCLN